MFKRLLFCFISTALLTSCTSPLFATPTPTVTVTPIPTSTPTITPLPTSTFTPMPTATETPVPTETLTLPLTSVKSRGQFEELVKAGIIKCLGYENDDDGAHLQEYMTKAQAALTVTQKRVLMLGSGIPSTTTPSQCLFLILFYDENSIVFYKDSETLEFVKLPIVE